MISQRTSLHDTVTLGEVRNVDTPPDEQDYDACEAAMKQIEAATFPHGNPVAYSSWPLGSIPSHLRRPEPEIVRGAYPWTDAREIVDIFERKVAEFTGAKYAVAVDCCTHGLELSIRYEATHDRVPKTISIPCQTYISVPMIIKQLGYTINFLDFVWTGQYCLLGTNVIDAAVRFMPDMYIPGTLQCLSFQIKKRVCIGRGGMILTDDQRAYEWLSLARYDGRDMSLPYDHPEHIKMQGWHYYLTPEDAARGIIIMDSITDYSDTANQSNYPNAEEMMKNI